MRRFTPSARRLLTLTGATFVGVAATLALAAPASATNAEITAESKCAENGKYTVTWTITNDYPRVKLTLTDVTVEPKEAPLSQDLNGKELTKDESSITVTQIVPGDATSAKLSFTPKWSNGHDTGDYKKTVKLKGTCKPDCPGAGSPNMPNPRPECPQPPAAGPGPGNPGPAKPPTLPLTGAKTGLIAGGAVALIAAGVGLFFLSRRRRIQFTA